jgi:hypothetical protein
MGGLVAARYPPMTRTKPVANINSARPARTSRRRSFSDIRHLRDRSVKAIRLRAECNPVTDDASVWRGPRFVAALYLAIVALTGLFGFVIGSIRPADLDPSLFMVLDLPPTPLGVALYGMLTVGIILGGLLLLVRYVGKEYDPHRVE